MDDVFFYEILILIKSKNIIYFFQIITNQTYHDYEMTPTI